jgi:hypothetical protein
MASAAETRVYEELVDFIAGGTTPQDVIRFEPSRSTKERVADLIEREKAAGLADDDARELDHFLTIEHLMRLAKAKARLKADR